MKTTYTIFRTDGSAERGEIDWPKDPGYKLIKKLVEPIVGEPFEHVTVLHNGKRADMFVDELGHVRIGGPSSLNQAATKIYRAASVRRGEHEESLPTIVGTAILFDRVVWK